MHCTRLPLRLGADLGGSYEADGFDISVVANGVHGVFTAMHHVQHAWGDTGFERQFAQAHGHHGVLLRGLEHEGVARGNGHGEHPQRDHGREVEGRDARAHAQGLQHGVGIHAIGHVVGQLAQLQVANASGVFHHFQAAEDVAFGVGQGLALLGREQRGQLAHVFAD